MIEAKLTECDFQSARKGLLMAYRDFPDMFDQEQLPQADGRYLSWLATYEPRNFIACPRKSGTAKQLRRKRLPRREH